MSLKTDLSSHFAIDFNDVNTCFSKQDILTIGVKMRRKDSYFILYEQDITLFFCLTPCFFSKWD